MGQKKVQPNYRRRTLRLPDLDHSKLAVLNSLGSPGSRRVYEFALDQFIAWYCSEPRLALSRIVVTRYRLSGWSPRKEDRWSCTCGHEWNTFDTGGVCPACLHQLEYPLGSQTVWPVGNLGHEKARIDRRGLAWAKGRNGPRQSSLRQVL